MSKEKLIEDVKKQVWDPSVQALVVFAELVKNLIDNIKWTADMGNRVEIGIEFSQQEVGVTGSTIPSTRGGPPYSNRATAKQYGGTARGDSMASRQAATRQNPSISAAAAK